VTILDGVLRWIGDRLPAHPDGLRAAVALPVLTVALYAAVAVLVRRVLPWLAVGVLIPLLGAAARAGGVALLSVQALGAVPFRLAHRCPPALLYQFGDAVPAASQALRRGVEAARVLILRLRDTPFVVLAAIVILLVMWWDRSSCTGPAAGCTRPVHGWTDGVSAVTGLLRHLLGI
jgi:hypothetical protein